MKSANAGNVATRMAGMEITDGRRLVNRVWTASLVTLIMFIASLVFVADYAGNLANRMTLESERRLVALEFERLAHASLRNMRLITRNDVVFSATKDQLDLDALRPEVVPKAWNSFGFESVVFIQNDNVKATAWLTQVSDRELDTRVIDNARDLVADVVEQFDAVKVGTRRGDIIPANAKREPFGLTSYGFRYVKGKLRLMVAQPLLPTSVKLAGNESSPVIAVSSLPVSKDLLAEMAARLHLNNLSLDDVSLATEKLGTALISNGPSAAAVQASWEPVPPRFAILRSVAPTIAILLMVAGVAVYIIGIRFSATLRALAASESRNRHLAHHDSLTGLANRSKFDLLIDEAIEAAEQKPFALLAIDLDHFKQANDTFGHEAGDHVLRTVARRMNAIISPIGEISRIGGDEFMALVHGVSDREALEFVCESLLESACQPVSFEGNSISIGSSIGVASAPVNGKTVGELMRNADEALYLAKDAGRGRMIFSGDDHDNFDRRQRREGSSANDRRTPAPETGSEVRVAQRKSV